MDRSDLNKNDKIDKDEADNIAQSIFSNDELTDSLLVDYGVGHLENNFNLGLENRRKSYLEKQDSTEQSGEFVKHKGNKKSTFSHNKEDINPETHFLDD